MKICENTTISIPLSRRVVHVEDEPTFSDLVIESGAAGLDDLAWERDLQFVFFPNHISDGVGFSGAERKHYGWSASEISAFQVFHD